MKYIVYDGIYYREYSNYESAERNAFILEGIIIEVDSDGNRKIVCDYSNSQENILKMKKYKCIKNFKINKYDEKEEAIVIKKGTILELSCYIDESCYFVKIINKKGYLISMPKEYLKEYLVELEEINNKE